MRDYIVLGLILAGLPLCVYKPYIGTLYWAWISFMNPHRYAWGAAVNFPVAMVVALATLGGFLFSSEKRRPPAAAPLVFLVLLWVYFGITTSQAIYPADASRQFQEVSKIILMALVTLSFCLTKKKFETLFLVVALSLGLVGLKGGIFGFATGGAYRVYGPPGSFMEDNNDFALALNMALPLLYYQAKHVTHQFLKKSLNVLFFFTIVSIILTFSRGGFLGLAAVIFLIGWQSPHRARFFFALPFIIALALVFLPTSYIERITSIGDYSEDRSSMGRINAWCFAFNLASERPLLGGGFQAFTPELFRTYAPDPDFYADAHSNYFEMLGEQGFLALFLYLCLLSCTLFSLRRLWQFTQRLPGFSWAADYSSMLAIGLIAYVVNGLTLGRAYFDLQYHFIIGAVALKSIVYESIREQILSSTVSENDLSLARSSVPAGNVKPFAVS